MIGGRRPVMDETESGKLARPEKLPAMIELNESVNAAHRLVGAIEDSMRAMNRSLAG